MYNDLSWVCKHILFLHEAWFTGLFCNQYESPETQRNRIRFTYVIIYSNWGGDTEQMPANIFFTIHRWPIILYIHTYSPNLKSRLWYPFPLITATRWMSIWVLYCVQWLVVGITNNLLFYNQAARHVFSSTYKHTISILLQIQLKRTWIVWQNQFTSNQIIPIAVKPIKATRSHPTQHISAK